MLLSEPCLDDRLIALVDRLNEELPGAAPSNKVDFLAGHGVLTHFFLNEQTRAHLFPLGSESPGYQKARDYSVQTASFALHASVFLQELLQELQGREIRVLTFKGAVLSQLLYGQLSSRPFGDIDLLIAPEDLPRVQALFLEMGLRRGYPSGLSAAQDKALVCFSKAMTFSKQGGRNFVDLHWRLMSQWLALELPFDDLWQRRQVVDVQGFGLWPTLGSEDQALFLALHGAQDGWVKLKTLLDLSCFLGRHQLDGELVCRLSGPRLALLRQGVGLSCCLLGIIHPREMEPFFKSEQRAYEFLRDSMLAKEPPHHRLLLPPLWSCSALEALRRSVAALLTPAVDDIRSVDLPPPLIKAYVLVRCFRILKKAVQRKRVF